MARGNGRITAHRSIVPFALVMLLVLVLGWVPNVQAAPTLANITGEIEQITLDTPGDHWSGGKIVVGGQWVILPRNLLLDLPANRLTLTQLFEQAPATCVSRGETGLAKGDACNTSGTGGFATISANRSDAGNVIAGDVLIEKGKELVTGTVTFIDYTDGYFRLSGQPALDNAGVIVRLNDPTSRHTIQQGLGCAVGNIVNCSPDPRFTLDPDNYTNTFTTGFPLCLPSAVSRQFPGLPAVPGVLAIAAGPTQSGANGTGDLLCPDTNRGPAGAVPENPVADSRRFAPIKVGDTVTAEGNFETIDNVTFLSSHTTRVERALQTRNDPSQPDYLFLEEVFIDAPGFINQRVRALFIGFTTLATPPAGTDVLFWTIHRDPRDNAIHEFPLGSTIGCDIANGGLGSGNCTAQGLIGAGGNIFRIRYDVDFVLAAAGGKKGNLPIGFGGADTGLSPCAQIRADRDPATGLVRLPEFAAACPSALVIDPSGTGNYPGTSSLKEEWSIMSPIPHEIQARTGHKLANPGIVTLDVRGATATNGQYLFPFGINLGGISLQEFVEVNLDLMNTPSEFSGIPWNLDRRLSPGGCDGACEAGAVTGTNAQFRLDPFPFENFDPRTQADFTGAVGVGGLPTGSYNDPVYTTSALTDVRNRIFSYVSPALGKFDGNVTVIPFNFIPGPGIGPPGGPPGVGGVTTLLTPPAFPILETPPRPLPPPLPANAVTLTAAPVGTALVGDNVVFTALASGGSGTYEYQFMAKVAPAGAFVPAQVYGPSATWTWDTAIPAPGGAPPGYYEFQVFARSVGSLAAVEAVNTVVYILTVPPTTSVGLTAAPASPVFVDNNVLFTADNTVGGTLTHQYQFWYRSVTQPTFSMAQDYGAANTYTWKATAGSYEWKVFARSTGSTAASEAISPIVPFVVNAPPAAAATGVSLSATPGSPQLPGPQVVFMAVGAGGSGIYEYQFSDNVTGAMTVIQPYSTTSTRVWDTASVLSGTYAIKVDVRNQGSASLSEASASTTYNLTTASSGGPATGVLITPDQPSPQYVGVPVQFFANGLGSSGYQYRFWFFDGAAWSMVQDYGVGSSWTLPASTPVGASYYLAVDVRTSSSVDRDTVAYLPYVISNSPATGVTLTPDQGSPHPIGAAVLFTASGTGSSGYQYRFWFHDGTTWNMVQDYGVGSSWSLPALTPVGNYTIAVDVRTSAAVYRDAVTYLPYQITP